MFVIPVFLVLNWFILFVPCTSIVLALLAVSVSERIAVLLVKFKLVFLHVTEQFNSVCMFQQNQSIGPRLPLMAHSTCTPVMSPQSSQ